MAKILAPNKEYTGVSASVPFINGEGQTNDLRLIEWFRDHGYTVVEEEVTEEKISVPEDEIAEETIEVKEKIDAKKK